MTEHPPIDTLARFARGVLPPRELAAVAIHVARCEVCRTAATRPSIHPEAAPTTYGEAIHRVAGWARTRAARHNRDRRQAPGALDQILALPTEDWNRAIRSSPRYQSYAFAQHALKTCKAGWSDNPHRSERLAQLALEVANRLPNREHGRRNLNDLRARAWAYVANCRRIQPNYFSVPEALEAASQMLQNGTADDRARADLLGFATSFLVETGRRDSALDLFGETYDLSTYLDDVVLRAKNLMLLGRLWDLENRYEEALAPNQRARALLQGSRNQLLCVLVKMNLASTQANVGYPRRGRMILDSIGPDQRRALPRRVLLRFVWIEASARRIQGDLRVAASLLKRVHQRFRDSEYHRDAALVATSLARVHLELGQPDQARELTTEAFRTFALHGLQRETVESLQLFSRSHGPG